ncbi:MAG: hypothetical protein H6650_05300 [Ardenticatenales bacterium]|nr:hypothetical protein [Ardenticatenales bacterium]
MTPRDWSPAARTGAVRAARVFSNLISPPVMFAIIGLTLALYAAPGWRGLAWGITYGLLVSLAPILFVLFMLRTGRIAELHMSNTGERHLPYLVSVFCGLLVLLLSRLFHGPDLLRCLAWFNVIELAALGIINIFWLISIHATAMASTVAIAWLVFGSWTLLITLPLLILVAWVRLFLKRHTPAQIIAGTLLGSLTVLSLTLAGCFT